MKTNAIVETLKVNASTYNFKAMKKDALDTQTYIDWVKSIELARIPFGNYALELRKVAKMGKDAQVNADIKTKAFDALQRILDVIGEVNGHPIDKNDAMLELLAPYALIKTKEKTGDFLTKYSELKNAKEELKNVHTGMNEDYVQGIEDKIAGLEIECKILRNLPESAKKDRAIAKPETFRKKFEENLYDDILRKEELLTAEEYEKRRLAIKEQKKIERQAKRQAAAIARAQANA